MGRRVAVYKLLTEPHLLGDLFLRAVIFINVFQECSFFPVHLLSLDAVFPIHFLEALARLDYFLLLGETVELEAGRMTLVLLR